MGIKRWGVGEISTVGKNMKVIENIDYVSRCFKVRCLGDSQTVDFFPVLKCVAANHVWRDYNTEQNVLQVLFLYYFADILFLS